jgi:hypothetical protein
MAFVAAISSGSLVTHAQTPAPTASEEDHSAHHPPESGQSKPAMPSPNQAPQSGDSIGMMGGDMGRMMAMMRGGTMTGGMPFQHVEGRLAFLKTELKITPAQQPQWDKFADAFRSVAKNAQGMMQQMMQGGVAKSTKAPDVFARYETMLMARLDAVRSMKSAFVPLYESLNDDQKKSADELMTSPMGMM